MSDRKGDWLTTFRGKQAWPLDMRVEDIDVCDVAHHLALQCRFGGAVLRHYSVGEHLVRASYVVEDLGGDPFAGLGHDAQEAYVVDVPRPLKRNLPGYGEIEDAAAAVVESWLGLPSGACSHPIVKRADEIMLLTEKRDHCAPQPAPWTVAQGLPCEPLRWRIDVWTLRGFARWVRVSTTATILALFSNGPIAAGKVAWDALREFKHSGPWPMWLTERRFLARYHELRGAR